MVCSLPASSVHETSQARILEWVAIPFSRGSSWPMNLTHLTCLSFTAGRFSIHRATCEWVTQLYLTLCDPMDYTSHGLLLARILEWVVFSYSRGSSQPRDWTQVSYITGKLFTSGATREAHWTTWEALFTDRSGNCLFPGQGFVSRRNRNSYCYPGLECLEAGNI